MFQDNSWFLDFKKADFQHAFSTRILWRIRLVKKPFGQFCMLVPMHLSVLEFFIFLGYFSLSEVDGHFGQYIIARWAKESQIFSIGPTLKGESHDHKSFPRSKNFTLSRSKVWILPLACVTLENYPINRHIQQNPTSSYKKSEFIKILQKEKYSREKF